MEKVLDTNRISLGNLNTNPILTESSTPEDFEVLNHHILNKAISGMVLGDRNPMWTAEDNVVSRSFSFTQPMTPINGQINDRIAHRFPVSDLNLPRDHIAVLQTAVRYSYENPFVSKACRIKADFACEGFKHKTHNKKVKEFYDEWVQALGLKTIVRKIFFSMFSVGIVPIWWGGEESRNIEFVELLDPRMCHIEYNFGKPILYLKIDEKMRAAVADPEGKLDIRNKSRYDAMPKYWVDQIKDAMKKPQAVLGSGNGNLIGYIELKEGSYALVDIRAASLNRTVSALDGLPLQPAFDALQRYRLFAAGDFAVAWSLKNMVTLISEGDPKAEGENWKPVSAARLAALQAQFQRPDTAYTVYCDPTTEVRFVVPPIKDVFAENKYSQVEKEIKEVLDLPSYMWVSEDKSNYSNATNEMKSFRTAIKAARTVLIEHFFIPFYKRLRNAVARPGFKESDIIHPHFSIFNLQDDSFYLKQLGSMYNQGLVSVETMLESMGLDYEYEAEQKAIEKKLFGIDEDTVFRPLFPPQLPQADAIGGSTGGKPAGPNQKQSNDNSPRRSGQK